MLEVVGKLGSIQFDPVAAAGRNHDLVLHALPVCFRDRSVGRIEPRIDPGLARVEVLGAWWEDGFAPRRAEGFVEAMRDALRAYLRFAGAARLEWAPHLSAERRLFPARSVLS
ncbi:MAG: hypothetical protein ACRDOU_02170 [Streptosporangiaceae bacterium]